jgi:hypothetical protein
MCDRSRSRSSSSEPIIPIRHEFEQSGIAVRVQWDATAEARTLVCAIALDLASSSSEPTIPIRQEFEQSGRAVPCNGTLPGGEPLYVRSLSIREQHLGADHPDTASSLNNLALLYGEWDATRRQNPCCAIALDLGATARSRPSHTASSLNNLAELYGAMGRYRRRNPCMCDRSRSASSSSEPTIPIRQ